MATLARKIELIGGARSRERYEGTDERVEDTRVYSVQCKGARVSWKL